MLEVSNLAKRKSGILSLTKVVFKALSYKSGLSVTGIIDNTY